MGSFVFVWGGRPFLEGAVTEVRDRAPGMMLLIAMAITVAWASSMASSLGWFDLEFWWELAALVTIMPLGHWQEMNAIGQARGAIAGIAGSGITNEEVVRLAGGVELDSEHPLARAIVTAARQHGEVAATSAFRAITGRGVEAVIDGHRYAVGGPVMLRERTLTVPDSIRGDVVTWTGRDAAVLYLVREDEIIGALALQDKIRPEAHQAVSGLHAIGIDRVVMITGDAVQVADAVAAELGIDEVFAEVLPEDKQDKVAELQARGYKVAMVGDGVNDAPALARADVGLAIGAGTDVAIESAGAVLAGNDPRSVTGVIRLSAASYRKMGQNLAWAAGYNIVSIPLAAGALSWAGITLAPAVGAILMSLSTIVVALNAQLLRRVDLRPTVSDVTETVPAMSICS